jgi:Protein of unknown function with HXXEE motif
MSPRSRLFFLLLVIAQAAHSVEEYLTRLFEVFAPARFVSGLVGDDLALGFVVVNVAFIGIGAWCYVGPVRAGAFAGQIAAAVWVAIELANGVAHLAIAAARGAYFSGSLTAILLVVTAGCLAFSLLADRRRGVPIAGGVA